MGLLSSDDHRALACALCGRPWAECTRMVRGVRGALCIDCVAPSVIAFEGPDSLALTLRVVLEVLHRKNKLTPLPESGRLIDAAVALAGNAVAELRTIVAHALALSHFEKAVELSARIAAPDRQPTDAINTAFACYRLGRFSAGLAALGTLDLATLDAERRALYLLNHAALTFETEPEASPGRLDELASRIEEARMLILMLPIDAERQRGYLAGVAEGQAFHAFRTRDYRRAVDRAKDARTLAAESSASVLLVLGDACAALGDDPGAHAAWLEAIKRAHPESRDAYQARKRLTGVYR